MSWLKIKCASAEDQCTPPAGKKKFCMRLVVNNYSCSTVSTGKGKHCAYKVVYLAEPCRQNKAAAVSQKCTSTLRLLVTERLGTQVKMREGARSAPRGIENALMSPTESMQSMGPASCTHSLTWLERFHFALRNRRKSHDCSK